MVRNRPRRKQEVREHRCPCIPGPADLSLGKGCFILPPPPPHFFLFLGLSLCPMKVASPFEIFWFSDSGTLAHIIITGRMAERAALTELVAAGPGPGQSLVHFHQVPGGTDIAAAAGPSKDFNDHCFVSTPFILAIRGDPEREKGGQGQ